MTWGEDLPRVRSNSLEAEGMPLAPSDSFSWYQPDDAKQEPPLKCGGFCEFVDIVSSRNGRVAIKVVNSERSKARKALDNEARLLSQLSHPNIVRYIRTIQKQQRVMMCMDAFDTDLAGYLAEYGPLPEHTAKVVIRQVLSALQFCHEQGITNRDVKPENILLRLSPSGDIERVAIGDFGLGHQFDRSKPRDEGTVRVGTRRYLAPEILRTMHGPETINPRRGFAEVTGADLWSVGLVLYRMLTGADLCTGSLDSGKGIVFYLEFLKKREYMKSSVWAPLSDGAKDLLKGLLATRMADRMSAAGALEHEWLCGEEDGCSSEQSVSTPSSPVH
eukprot:TRINITY_DN6942_c0_g5_i3.p1 TRINITY_DN6942_c0_g5~~TRINITY_DN6942_c0_g5_i3.p1  ORF type:complete len:332 (+),score=110.38 TRINITY_DN6942_c0_g5_i3:55-1050(+)